MRRILLTVLIVLLVGVMPGLAQQQHLVATPDTLKWIDPPTFPGAKMAIVQGDPGKEGLFMITPAHLPKYLGVPKHEKESEEKKDLVELYVALSQNEPPAGDAKDWKKKTSAMVAAAKKAVTDEAAAKALSKVVNCGACHKAHKG